MAPGNPTQMALPLNSIPTMVETVATAMSPAEVRLWAVNNVAVILRAND
jgi:hypothetical protein